MSPCQADARPALLTPAAGALFSLSPGVPRDRQQIEIKARAGDAAAKLTIYVDGQALAVFSGPPYQAFWQLAPGRHRVLAEARDGQGQVWKSDEVEFAVEEQR